MTTNDNKSYLGYLNKLVEKNNNTDHLSIAIKPIDAYYSALSKEIDTNPKST